MKRGDVHQGQTLKIVTHDIDGLPYGTIVTAHRVGDRMAFDVKAPGGKIYEVDSEEVEPANRRPSK